eukprot:XP_001705326.1 Hypothetical protein GL50803_35574 [Giardia lamblia ATCC 50803]
MILCNPKVHALTCNLSIAKGLDDGCSPSLNISCAKDTWDRSLEVLISNHKTFVIYLQIFCRLHDNVIRPKSYRNNNHTTGKKGKFSIQGHNSSCFEGVNLAP